MSGRPTDFPLTSAGEFRLYSTAELLRLPPPEWLIDGVLPAGGLVGLYGPSGTGKSFVAIDLALCVATGRPWQGHDVAKGSVLYVSAEGGTGVGKRALAWLLTNEVDPTEVDMAWMIEPIPIHTDSDQLEILLNRIIHEARLSPSLVVVDTLARCFDGDENETEDMGRFVAGIDVLRHQLGTTVLVVHHTRLGGDRERGNTALRSAADTMIALEGDGPGITLTCNKQKDDAEFDPIELERVGVDGTESCIVRKPHGETLRQQRIDTMYKALESIQPARWTEWIDASGLGASLFNKTYPRFKAAHPITKTEEGLWTLR
jgi:archaellum biogenesis ATPase FlaH